MPCETRYDNMRYRRCGKSGLLLPLVSLGLWHNFGADSPYPAAREMLLGAFDLGITHFDLANNYGPPPGSAEETFGRVMAADLRPYRDELIISSKAGYDMWPGPYGNFGSRKYIVASCDQSLKRTGLEYFDIFYHHRPDPDTPLEESMDALAQLVRQGKALYVGISNYGSEDTRRACAALRQTGVKCLIHQPAYSMFNRWSEDGLLDALFDEGMGAVAFSPLAQGLLTGKYINGIPMDSRAAGASVFLTKDAVTAEKVDKTRKLAALAAARGQTLAQMALAWVLRSEPVTSVIIGARSLGQIKENAGCADNIVFTEAELREIDGILGQG